MNREIKFKAWLIAQKKMVIISGEFSLKHFMDNTHYLDSNTSECDGLSSISEFELLQFIGILDKNGNEIYENYIVKHEFLTKNYVVKYDSESARYYLHNDTVRLRRSLSKSMRLEIIGNIYENPELLSY